MSVRNGIALFLALSALTFLIACGGNGGSVTHPVPPPSGSFSNSSLNGTYVFSASGSDVANNAFFAIAGTIVANGSGGLTGGSFDLIDTVLGVSSGNSVSGGTYHVGSDGRGTATLPGNLGVDFVLTSNVHGLIVRFDNGGTGSGTLDLQGATTTITGSYSFSFAGVDSLVNPFNSVGAFTVDGTGTITAGVQDFNDHYTTSSEFGLTALPLTGTVAAGASGAKLTTTSTFATQTFDVFPVDSAHLKFIETDGGNFLAGDAFTQQTTMPPAGQLVFTMAGFDVNNLFFAAGGYLTSDGTSQITAGLEDINDPGIGAATQATPSLSSFTSTGNGRFTITLNGILNGGASTSSYTFAAYPSSGGIQLLEIDGFGITSGAAYAQSATSLGTPQGYALNLTGADSSGNEVDEIAEFTAQNGALTGIADINDGGALNSALSLGSHSTYTVDSPATGRGEISTTQFGLVFYVVDSSNVIFIETDSSPVGLGTFQLQNSSGAAAAAAAQPVVSMFRPVPRTRAALRHK